MDEFCAHRGVSLWFGRNEENGLRCPYHGWKYDYTGQCVDVPSEPQESGFCNKIKLNLSAVEAAGFCGLTWGQPELKPSAAVIRVDGASPRAPVRQQAVAGMQLPSGDGGRHRFEPRPSSPQRRTPFGSATSRHQGRALSAGIANRSLRSSSRRAVSISVRAAMPSTGHYYWRVTTMGSCLGYTMVPPYGDNALNAHAFVPIDDENCFTLDFTYHSTRRSARWSSTPCAAAAASMSR